MQHTIEHGPSYAVVKVNLQPGDVVTAESGAMMTRSDGVRMETRLNAPRSGGIFAWLLALLTALVRKVLGGETMFINDFVGGASGGNVTLAPSMSGHVMHRALHGDKLLLWGGAFLACSKDISLRTRWGGLRGLLAREGLFFIEASGTGDVFFTSYGGVEPVKVNGTFIVDTGHLVAFDGNLDFNITSPGGGLIGFLGSGEGLVCRFHGNGTVYVQSRNTSALVSWLTPFLPR